MTLSPQQRPPPDYTALFHQMMREPGFFPWSTEPETGEFIWALTRMLGAQSLLELGTFRGYVTLQLIRALDSTTGLVVTVDCTDHRSPVLRQFDSHYEFIQGDDRAILPRLDRRFDLVYLDTTHTFEHTLEELELLHRHQPQATVLCHDPISFPDVARAIDRVRPYYSQLILPTPVRQTFGTVSGLAILVPANISPNPIPSPASA